MVNSWFIKGLSFERVYLYQQKSEIDGIKIETNLKIQHYKRAICKLFYCNIYFKNEVGFYKNIWYFIFVRSIF